MFLTNIYPGFYEGEGLGDKLKELWLPFEGVWVTYLCCKEHCIQQLQTHLEKKPTKNQKSLHEVRKKANICGIQAKEGVCCGKNSIVPETLSSLIDALLATLYSPFKYSVLYFLLSQTPEGLFRCSTYLNLIVIQSIYLMKRELNIPPVFRISSWYIYNVGCVYNVCIRDKKRSIRLDGDKMKW